MPAVLLLVFSFLVGGIPFALLAVAIVLRKDVRKSGSGNVGATNAARQWKGKARMVAFIGIFLLDAAKGYIAAGLLPEVLGLTRAPWPAAAGMAVVLGHVFTPYLKTLGGKGVATTIGVLFALEPVATSIALGALLVVYLLTRTVALGSLTLAFTLPLATYLHGEADSSVLTLTVLLAVLILLRHTSNIRRLIRGTEP